MNICFRGATYTQIQQLKNHCGSFYFGRERVHPMSKEQAKHILKTASQLGITLYIEKLGKDKIDKYEYSHAKS